jgi:putative tryptophan/tyrosine transport system permease protein
MQLMHIHAKGSIMVNIIFNLMEQFCLYFPLIGGAYISLSLLKVPDMSLQSSFVFGAILSALASRFMHQPSLSMLVVQIVASMLGGIIVGMVVVALTRFGNIPYLLASIITIGIFYGASQIVLGSSYQSLGSINSLALSTLILQHPELPVLTIVVLLTIVGIKLISRSKLGFCLAAYGNTPTCLSYHGISTTFVYGIGIGIANAFAGLSGYLTSQSSGFVDIHAGSDIVLFAITALILGKTAIRAKVVSLGIGQPIYGLVIYCAIQQALCKSGFNLKYFTAIQAVIVMIVIMNALRKNPQNLTDSLGV